MANYRLGVPRFHEQLLDRSVARPQIELDFQIRSCVKSETVSDVR
jgi:hypothetical protein